MVRSLSNSYFGPDTFAGSDGAGAFMSFSDALDHAESLGGDGFSTSPGSQSSFAGLYGQDDDSASDSYTSQFSKMIDAANKAQMWKKLTSGGGYKGGFAQGMGGSPISGGGYQSLGKGKGIFQYQPAQIAGIINHPQKQKSGGFSIGGAVKGLVTGLSTGIPHMGAVGAVAGGFA